MTLIEKFAATTASLEDLSDSAARLNDALRVTDAPAEVLGAVEEKLHEALDLLRGFERKGPHSQSLLNDSQADFFARETSVPHELMPYSPLIGRRNPVSPRFELQVVENRVEGRGRFPVRYAGAPQTAHGGLVAALLDEIMGMVNFVNGEGAFTGTLTVRYHGPTPIDRDLTAVAEIVRVEGRKILSRAEIRCDGALTASAEGLFIKPR
jgi:acyl-coenzyme A thioesterase PaaI-like protein